MLVGLGPVVQDGIRYAAPVFAPMALGAGLGLGGLWRFVRTRLQRHPIARRIVGGVGALLVFGPLLLQVALYHPYYLDYYTEPVGPAKALAGRLFEVGWWCEGLQPAMKVVNRRAPQGATVGLQSRFCTDIRGLRPDLRPVRGSDADYVIRAYLLMAAGQPPATYERVHTEEVMGATLVEVWKRPGTP